MKQPTTHGGKRRGAGRKIQPPRIFRNCLIINLAWLDKQKPKPTLETILDISTHTAPAAPARKAKAKKEQGK